MKSLVLYVAGLIGLATLSTSVLAEEGPGTCAHCGNCCHTRKICRVVPEKKKVSGHKWECECEDFCVPGPSEHCGKTCVTDECGKSHFKINWRPGCAEVRTKTVLKKISESEEVCSWKWVVEEVCDSCMNRCGGQTLRNHGHRGECQGCASGCASCQSHASVQAAEIPVGPAPASRAWMSSTPILEDPTAR